jgi:hypothetical protein
MKKIIIIILLFISLNNCGFQPIYLNKDIKKLEFKKITSKGSSKINNKIIQALAITENSQNKNLEELILNSVYEIQETSKNSQGVVKTYSTSVSIDLSINKNENIIANKVFSQNFSYNNNTNKFELKKYQDNIEKNLIEEITREILLYLNTL